MVFISEAQPGVVFLVLLWICKFSFQGSWQPVTHIWEQLEGLAPWSEEAEKGDRTQVGTNLLPLGSRAPRSNCRRPPAPAALNMGTFVCDANGKQKKSSQKTIWCFSCVYIFGT